jgi:transposase-like protein
MAKRGRPFAAQAYDPNRHPAEFLALREQGYSVRASAGAMRVHHSTIYEWCKQHPEFKEAFDLSDDVNAYTWERTLIEATTAEQVRKAVFALPKLHQDQWRERQSHELTGPDGGPIQTQDMTPREKLARFLGVAEGADGSEPE